MYEEFKKIFDRFSFHETAGTEENDNKDESAQNAALSKKSDSDSEEEEQDNQQKEKGVSNKKKKLQRRMKIAELRQICLRPDVVEKDWDLVKQMAENYPSVIPCFGLHPWYVAERTPSWFNTLKENLECTPSAAVGEIGLDKGSRGKEIDFTDQVLLSQFLVAQ